MIKLEKPRQNSKSLLQIRTYHSYRALRCRVKIAGEITFFLIKLDFILYYDWSYVAIGRWHEPF